MKKIIGWVAVWVIVLFNGTVVNAVASTSWKERRQSAEMFIFNDFSKYEHEMKYFLMKPKNFEKNREYPLIVNMGPAGFYADPRISNNIGEPLTAGENVDKYPCYILTPYCPDSETWIEDNEVGAATLHNNISPLNDELEMIIDIIEEVKQRYNIDSNRIYLYGFSNGASGGWTLLGKRPDIFAAALLLAGQTDVSNAAKLIDIPIWTFHSIDDKGIPSVASHDMIEAIKMLGGTPLFTEYAYGSHVITGRVFKEPNVFEWLFSKRKHNLVDYIIPDDIGLSNESYNAIKYLGKRKLIPSFENINLNKQVTVSEFLNYLVKIDQSNFGNLDSELIEKVGINKMSSESSNSFFSSDQLLTREIASHIIVQFLNDRNEIDYSLYQDRVLDLEEVDEQYRNDVLYCFLNGIICDSESTIFNPKLTLTEEELIKICYRIIEEGARLSPVNFSTDQRKLSHEIIGYTQSELVGEREIVRTTQTNLGTLIADAIRNETKADIGLMQGGGIRDSITQGNITISNIYAVLPFDNVVTVVEMKGNDLLVALNNGYSAYPEASVAYPHLSGINVTLNLESYSGNRVIINSVNGEFFDINKVYKVATNNYISEGGDGYEVMKKCKVINSYGTIAEMLINYIKSNSEGLSQLN